MGMRSVSVGMLNQAVSFEIFKKNSRVFQHFFSPRATQTCRNLRHHVAAFSAQQFPQPTKSTAAQKSKSTSTRGVLLASSADEKECKTPTAASTSPQPGKMSQVPRSRRRQTSPLVLRNQPCHRGHETFHRNSDESPTLILCSTRKSWNWPREW